MSFAHSRRTIEEEREREKGKGNIIHRIDFAYSMYV